MYNKLTVGFEEAHGAIMAMIEAVKSHPDKYWQWACMAVVDNSGVPICVAKLDGGTYIPYEQAIRKARTSALWATDTSAYQEMISKRDWSEQTYGDYTVCPGGVAIVPPGYEGKIDAGPVCLGAIGVSGAGVYTVDEQLARVGLDHIRSVLWPSK